MGGKIFSMQWKYFSQQRKIIYLQNYFLCSASDAEAMKM